MGASVYLCLLLTGQIHPPPRPHTTISVPLPTSLGWVFRAAQLSLSQMTLSSKLLFSFHVILLHWMLFSKVLPPEGCVWRVTSEKSTLNNLDLKGKPPCFLKVLDISIPEKLSVVVSSPWALSPTMRVALSTMPDLLRRLSLCP